MWGGDFLSPEIGNSEGGLEIRKQLSAPVNHLGLSGVSQADIPCLSFLSFHQEIHFAFTITQSARG